jgi:hypothetical protein
MLVSIKAEKFVGRQERSPLPNPEIKKRDRHSSCGLG